VGRKGEQEKRKENPGGIHAYDRPGLLSRMLSRDCCSIAVAAAVGIDDARFDADFDLNAS
jgi:hypothetical protein